MGSSRAVVLLGADGWIWVCINGTFRRYYTMHLSFLRAAFIPSLLPFTSPVLARKD